MAQINLLKQNQPSSFSRFGIFPILNYVAIAGILALLGFYGWEYFQNKQADKKNQELASVILQQKQELSSISNRDELFSRQAQLKGYDELIAAHPYWSQVLPELAKVTLKRASYMSIKIDNQGIMDLSVQVPTMADLEKFLQVFDSAKLNKYFRDLRISGISKIQDEAENYIKVDVQLKYDASLLNYKAAK